MDWSDYENLATNWQTIDYHDMSLGRGVPIPEMPGGVLTCDCNCHIPIGSGQRFSDTHSCEHCELIG